MGFCENAAIKENPLFQPQDSSLNDENLFNSSILENPETLMEGGKVGASSQLVDHSVETLGDTLIYKEEKDIICIFFGLEDPTLDNQGMNIKQICCMTFSGN